ncbi:response regulator [Paenibacillus sp. J5C_2022]|uniref:response regulator n=1 Tax=Paenibacillus sp. J5C2022 TaxID=2977129 RepID=UPI0021D112EE|nr:response regulator [Paenibacillus sp. J5C2022]MCU6709916.1 response regulator [Paenibacillus sp. J5C2022]
MIRVMAVDDESPALRQVERVLRAFTGVDICGLFTDVDEFMARLHAEPVDLVLLDMEMSDSHGLQLAQSIRSIREDICIAFVTAYDEYAVDAFDADAIDYLLKPVTEERMQRTLHRCLQRQLRSEGNAGDRVGTKSVTIHCFGRFAIMTGQEPVRFRNSKSEELLAYLIHHNREPVDKAQIMEALWPGRDPVRTLANLYSTVYQLRKDMEASGLYDVIEQSKGGSRSYRLRLSPDHCDLYEYERLCGQIKSDGFDLALAERAVELYRGGYLQDHDYGWASLRKTELEFRYEEQLEEIVHAYVQLGRYRSAVPILQTWAERFPFDERIHAKMIALYLLMGSAADARKYAAHVGDEIYRKELGAVLDLDVEIIALNPHDWLNRTSDG